MADVNFLLDAARVALGRGLCVVPPAEDGTKRPDGAWKRFQAELPTEADLTCWYGRHTGIGLVCGSISGGLTLLEFERSAIFAAYIEAAHALGLAELIDRLRSGYEEETPGGGIHWLYYCAVVRGNTKLASCPAPAEGNPHRLQVLIETRGEGGYVVTAPTFGAVHPTGRPYTLRSGGWASIPTISPAEQDQLWALARTFDQTPEPTPEPSRPRRERSEAGTPPGADYNARATWDDLLLPAGWVKVFTRGDITYWRRPGKDQGWSACSGKCQAADGTPRLKVFSTSTPFDTERSYDLFAAYAHLHHEGDLGQAARSLRQQGYGSPPPTNGQRTARNGADRGSEGGSVRSGPFVPGDESSVEAVPFEWEPPVDAGLIAAVPFPLDVLPGPLRRLCEEIAASMQCPVDYPGALMLALAGAAIGRSAILKVKAHYYEPANLYLTIVGPPGTKKTPPMKLLAAPLWEINRDLMDEYAIELADHQQQMQEHEVNRKRRDAVAGPAPPPPTRRALVVDDATREAVAVIHAENTRGLVVVKDELSGWVSAMNAYKPGGKGDDKQFWLSVNSGAPIKVDRKGTRDPILIAHPCVTVSGPLTPGNLPLIKGQVDDGWLDRILFAYPDPLYADDWTDAEVSDDAMADWRAAVRRLWETPMPVDERGRHGPNVVALDPAAKDHYVGWVNSHRRERRVPGFAPSLHGPWSKMEGYCARLALILGRLHQATDPTDNRPPTIVGALDVWGACKLADYFKHHFRRARAELTKRPEDACEQAGMVLAWILEDRLTHFTGRDVIRRFRSFTNADRSEALHWLQSRRYLRELPGSREPGPDGGRRPSGTYEVSPYVTGDNADSSDKTPRMDEESGVENYPG